jgi:Zn-dependent metalloprotease
MRVNTLHQLLIGKQKAAVALLFSILLLMAESGLSISFNDNLPNYRPNSGIDKSRGLGQKIRFNKIKKKNDSSFSLTYSKDLPFREYVLEYLEPFNISDDVEIRAVKSFKKDSTSRQSIFYKFYIGGLEIDGFYIKANKQKDGSVFITGNVPNIDQYQGEFYNSQFPSELDAENALSQFISGNGFLFDPSRLKTVSKKQCASVKDFKLLRASCFEISYGNQNYKIVVDQLGISRDSLASFNATATLKNIFVENWKGSRSDHNVTILDEPGNTLNNSRFIILPSDGDIIKSNSSSEFTYPALDSSEARQIHAYSFANRMFDWYEALGVQINSQKIKIYTGATFEVDENTETTDNAAFFPGSNSIMIGKGETQFKHLGIDIDVVAHEVGHFIVFKGISNITNQDDANNDHTQAIHEGLADFFTFASTGDSCLGESVCVPGGLICVSSSCLRTGEDIGFVYNTPDYKKRAFHQQGQLVAAILWEARGKQSSIDYFEFDQVVLNALDYIPNGNLSYGDLIVGIMASDKELQDGKFCEDIYDAAVSYSLTTLLDGHTCDEINGDAKSGSTVDVDDASESKYKNGINTSSATELSGGGSAPTGGSASATSSRRQETSGCGILGTSENSEGGFMLIFLLGLPFMLMLAYKVADQRLLRQPVKIKSNIRYRKIDR